VSACGQCHNCVSGGPCYHPVQDRDPRDADRIAQLEAELAEARKATADAMERLGRVEQRERAGIAAHERTKVAKRQLRKQVEDITSEALKMRRERDAAIAREQAAQADAAAMRACLGAALRWAEQDVNHAVAYDTALAEMRHGLSSTAGRALAARVPLWRELETATRACDAGSIAAALRKLAALGEKGGGR
jgi:hypothetical protein